jgi:DNA repair photolyase
MVEVIRVHRKTPVLTPSSLACLADIPAINLTSGCIHGCVYCYARGYSNYPGDNKIVIYSNTLEKVKAELAGKRIKPSNVYFSPSTDVFQPVSAVLELGYSIFEFLFSRNIGVSFLTKGHIPEKTMELLLNNAPKVKAQIGIITPDDNIRKTYEPCAASIDTRLHQMALLTAAGIEVEARMMPILPGITDNPEDIKNLFEAICDAGVYKVAVSTLFIRPSIAAALRELIPDKNSVQKVVQRYINQERMSVHAKNSSVIPLPRVEREKTYAQIKEIAAKYRIDISICGCMNPDVGGSCNIARTKPVQFLQPSLFA